MLPVSGAEQLKTSDAKETRPICSEHSAYSNWPVRRRDIHPGRERWRGPGTGSRPSALALAFSSSRIGMTFQRSPSAFWRA